MKEKVIWDWMQAQVDLWAKLGCQEAADVLQALIDKGAEPHRDSMNKNQIQSQIHWLNFEANIEGLAVHKKEALNGIADTLVAMLKENEQLKAENEQVRKDLSEAIDQIPSEATTNG